VNILFFLLCKFPPREGEGEGVKVSKKKRGDKKKYEVVHTLMDNLILLEVI
jgi:hypothetical protein